MRLPVFMAIAMAASAIAGGASAHGSSFGGASSQVKVTVCYKITAKPITIKGKLYFPGVIASLKKSEADSAIAAKKAVLLNAAAWAGKRVCLVDASGKAVDENGNPPAPVVTPPPPVVTPPPPPPPPPASNDDKDEDDDDKDEDDDDKHAPPPPPPPAG